MTQNSLQIPNELKERKQWVVWRLEENQAGALKKVPYQAGFRGHASTTNPSTWCSYEMALASCGNKLTPQQGIGFVFNGTYVGIDFDFKSTNGRPTKEQQDRAKTLDSYTEISPSGKGWHVIVKGNLAGRAGLNSEVLEIYDEGRYFTFTGQLLSSSGWNTIKERSQVVQKIYDQYKNPENTFRVDLNSGQGCGTPKSGLVHEGTRDSTLANWAMVAARLEQKGTIRGDLETLLCELAASAFAIDAKGQQGIEGLKHKLASARRKLAEGRGETSLMSSLDMGEPTAIKWDWPQWIPSGCMTMVAGASGTKKSFLAARLAASYTAGRDWPDGSTNELAPKKTCVLTNEGRVMHYEWRRRAIVLGADQSKLFFFPTAEPDKPLSHAPDLVTEFDHIVNTVASAEIEVLIIDSLSGGHSLKENSPAMRKLLQPLSAAMPGVTILVVHHARKAQEQETPNMTLDRVRGSTTITQFCRSVIGVYEKTPLTSTVCPIKSNFGMIPSPQDMQIDGDAESGDFHGVTFTEAPRLEEKVKVSKKTEAYLFIKNATSQGPMARAALMRLGAEQTPPISESTISRAGKEYGVVMTETGWYVAEPEVVIKVGGVTVDSSTTAHSFTSPAPVVISPLSEKDLQYKAVVEQATKEQLMNQLEQPRLSLIRARWVKAQLRFLGVKI